MKRFLCEKLPTRETSVALSTDEAKHAIQVFRLRDGDQVEALDGRGHVVRARLRVKGKANVLLEYAGDLQANATNQLIPVTLELAVLKGPAMEWAIEKATELGVKVLQPVLTERTVVQLGKKPAESFLARWRKISDQALKQCGRLIQMTILHPRTLDELLQKQVPHRVWCDEESEPDTPFLLNDFHSLQTSSAVHLLIGPEGGWSPAERQLLNQHRESATRVTLGPLIQRAETAAIFACSVAAAHFRSKSTGESPS